MRVAALILIALLASAADAASRKAVPSPTAQAPNPAAASGLRGPVPLKPKAAPISLITPASTAPADMAQCRRTCSHSYYFCLAGEGASDCPQSWTTCLSDCARPTPPLRAGSE